MLKTMRLTREESGLQAASVQAFFILYAISVAAKMEALAFLKFAVVVMIQQETWDMVVLTMRAFILRL